MPKIFHAGISLDYIIRRRGIDDLVGSCSLDGGKTLASRDELLAHCVILSARGFNVLPTCSHTTSEGFCRGHEIPQSVIGCTWPDDGSVPK
jgi:hypothetical protein